MTGAAFQAMTLEEIFEEAGRGAAKVVAFRPAFAVSQLTTREILAMGALLHVLGLSTPETLPSRTKKSGGDTRGGL